MLHLKVRAKDAQKAKKALMKAGVLDKGSLVQRIDSFAYFPIIAISSKTIKSLLKLGGAEMADIPGKFGPRQNYHALLKDALGDDAKGINTGYDSLGNIALIESPNTTREKARSFGMCIIKANPSISTVLAKAGPVRGEYRTRRLSYICGKRTFMATYRENDCVFRFDTRKTFFSGRLAYERKRIASQVRKNENVVVMFAGMGPFAIEIAKMKPECSVIGIELNKYACGQMLKNAAANRTGNVKAVFGNVRKKGRNYADFADRIIMPLPKQSIEFLDDAFRVARNGCTVHLYSFVDVKGGRAKLEKRIREHARENSYKVRILFERSVRPYSAMEEELVVDYRISKCA